jgi:nitrite reductase/ring-hydroxylating ferredoxin subunit
MPDITEEKQERDFTVMNKIVSIIAIIALAFTLQQCKKGNDIDGNTDFFPPVQVKTQLNLNLPQYIPLTFPQGYIYLPEGNKGIIVYHTPQGGYVAYDRTCSYKPDSACSKVVVDSSLASIRCGSYEPNATPSFKPCCSSRFDLNTGIALELPAKYPLKGYYTSFDESQKILYISSTPF